MSGWASIYNNSRFALMDLSETIAKLQENAASGQKVNRASDNPIDALRIMSLRSTGKSLQNYSRNLDQVSGNMQFEHDAMQDVSTTLIRVQQLLTQAASGTYVDTQRAVVAEEIDSLLNHVVGLANTEVMGRHIFGGADGLTTPYAVETADRRITAVRYQGGTGDLRAPVAAGMEIQAVTIGDRVFRSDSPSRPVFLGATGAKAGSGTSSVRGNVWLTVTHEQTLYLPATGVSAGVSSSDDTVAGLHKLTIDAANKTIRLDDGPAVAFQAIPGENDLELQNTAGQMVHVDLSGWSGYDGEISITATARLSIDDGATDTTVTAFTDNVIVTDSRTDRVLFVDTRDLAATGVEPVAVPGTHDVFGALIGIRDVLLGQRGLSEDRRRQFLQEAMDSIKDVTGTLTRNMTAVGARLQAMDNLRNSLEDRRVNAEEQAAALQDADIVQVAMELARSQTLYEMTLLASSKLLSLSLLDFLK